MGYEGQLPTLNRLSEPLNNFRLQKVISTAGDWYAPMVQDDGASSGNQLHIVKSTDQGHTWSDFAQWDPASIGYRPTSNWFATCARDKKIYGVITVRTTPFGIDDYRVVVFDADAGTFTALAAVTGISGASGLADIAVLSDGTVCLHRFIAPQLISSTNYVRTGVNFYSAGSWSSTVAVSGQAGVTDNFFGGFSFVGDSDRWHLLFYSNTTQKIRHIAWRSGSFGTMQTPVPSGSFFWSGAGQPYAMGIGCGYTDGSSAKRIAIPYFQNFGDLNVLTADDSDIPTFTDTSVAPAISGTNFEAMFFQLSWSGGSSFATIPQTPNSCSAVQGPSGTVLVLYQWNITDPSNNTIETDLKTVSYNGSTWGTPVVVRTFTGPTFSMNCIIDTASTAFYLARDAEGLSSDLSIANHWFIDFSTTPPVTRKGFVSSGNTFIGSGASVS